ncbi:PP2C family serine/threonine-protein phosphatase [Luteimonas sp. MC1572]|uniref:PP2C family protein-serine/threonine phosphatase n=1 Tax=Luteimonas sp. MC1572 TaxID=2799325 RepID=UPI0018F0833F|nr:PP2C family serine/threonine-protein phosphatase [Luteimonas sp. MC1572]MBJ6980343.1 serine/threonine-protein phosphatase [Luteimonas sp. MC1572]QQO04229.1 serine/threonine-protein phosphatase [Luteimonas sp. MC1572]
MQPVLYFEAAAATDPGWRFNENQDAVLLGAQLLLGATTRSLPACEALLVAVADGLAHAPCASRASCMVLEELVKVAGDRITGNAARVIQRRMTSAVAGTRCEGMASTLAAVQFTQDEVRVLSVGDTRVYLWRDQNLRQLTVDHTIANRMVREGDLTAEQAAVAGSLYEDLDSALVASGIEDVFDVFFTALAPRAGDLWLCVSDGVHGALTDSGIAEMLATKDAAPENIVALLVEIAKANTRLDDNLSAVAVRVMPSANATFR